MGLNKQKGNMYGFVSHTFNIIKGACSHNCTYCYMKRFPQGLIHFDNKELETDLGKDNFIFVGSSCDMWAENIPDEWIIAILDLCGKYDNTYLFQTKNPKRFIKFKDELTKIPKIVLGTTIETNRQGFNYNSPSVMERQYWIGEIDFADVMVTLEPIMDFDLDILIEWIKDIHPKWVNIGADSNKKKNYVLPEPTKEKILQLAKELNTFTEVINKENLGRLIK